MRPPQSDDCKRRTFLATAGTGIPTLRLLASGAAAADAEHPGKFTPIDLARLFNASPADFGPRKPLRPLSPDALVHTLAGNHELRGIPFRLGPGGPRSKRWIALSAAPKPWARPEVEIPAAGTANYLCLAQFCDYEPVQPPGDDVPPPEKIGQPLAHLTVVYADGSEATLPIRRRFEVCTPTTRWGHRALLALSHPQLVPAGLADPLPSGNRWGQLQTVVKEDGGPPFLWISALRNPHPERPIKAVRMRAAEEDVLALCGLTLFHGKENPLRYERRAVYRITLPEADAAAADRWEVSVDLGVVARSYALPAFDAPAWLATTAGTSAPADNRYLYAEVTASREAALTLRDAKSRRTYRFDLAKAGPGEELQSRPAGPAVQLVERDRAWVKARVVDAATGRPVPVRLAFRSRHGRYIPPYGHRTEINTGWFQDYGADLRVGPDSYAYVDGEFQVELPTGEVYVEVWKGFEYAPLRQKLNIEASQRELRLEIAKHTDMRSQGWVNADTHVHFISPSTAVLEGQAEGLNLINLLAAQWGDLYTSVGDLPHGPLASRDGETVVWPGTENRHHLMGHIGLLGGTGSPVFPMSGGFPYGEDEAYLGDPLWMSMSEWADACRAREGLTVAVHFPSPLAELAADIVLGKIDAVELPTNYRFDSENFREWYRYLNCGFRLPVAGGTDKMSAGVAVGRARTYAFVGPGEFSFANWARAVRGGKTFTTSGPLLTFAVDGRVPGHEIALRSGGATVEVEARARSATPVHRLEIVLNGRVVASREEKNGALDLALREKVAVAAPGWMAARCEDLTPRRFVWGSPAAHTSPVYLTVPGKELFSAPIASYMMNLIDGTRTWVEEIATRADPERFERIRKVFLDARAELERRMKAHGA